ncbi:MAG: PIN domain-containing protein [Nostoc sp.]
MTIYVLDTDDLSLYGRNHPVVIARLLASQVQLTTTAINIEEQLKGRLAQVAEAKNGATQSSAYSSYRLSEVQEPHPQPPPRKRGGGYDVPYVIRKRYIKDL